jgi:hypothetical protein
LGILIQPESKRSWQQLLPNLKQRGLTKPPKLAVGDGALGFRAALQEVYPPTKDTALTIPQLSHEHWYKNWGVSFRVRAYSNPTFSIIV